MDIALLKEIIESQDKRIHQTIIEELDKRMKYDKSLLVQENQYSSGRVRQKRPYRLLPTQNKGFGGIEKNENNINLNQHQRNSIFYGPPTNCSDLSRLGYTLNGYYLVKTDESNNEVKNLQSIYCAFKQPGGSFNSSTLEKRIGHLKLIDDNKSELSGGNFNSIGKKDVDVKGRGVMNTIILPPRMSNLINGLGKCAAIRDNVSIKNKNLIQWECNQEAKGMLWSWNETSFGSGNRHLCNGHGKCAASPRNSPSNIPLVQWESLDENGQKFHFLDLQSRPGFYLIKNDHGKCLAVPENKKYNGALIFVSHCNVSELGQHWKWYNMY